MEERAVDAFMAELENEDVVAEANFSRMDAVGFCDAWPTVKRILVFIRDEVLGGGVGSRLVKWAIGQIIKIGDRSCPNS
jgi:hypothetical protein